MSTLLTPLEKAKKVIKSNFSIVDEKNVEHFPDLTGQIVRMVINYQGKKLAVFIAQTNNDIILRLFDSSRPESYFIDKKWVIESALRSNKPFIFNWKVLYDEPNKKSWIDAQLPLHKLPEETIAVFFKMFDTCKEIKESLEM